MNKNTSGFKWRAYLTIGLIIFNIIGASIYGWVRPALDGKAAAMQLNGGTADLAMSAMILKAVTISLWISIFVIAWIWFIKRPKGFTALILLASFMVTGCGPARVDKFVEISPNETAFVIPLQGDTAANQATFNSVAYLNTKKVAAKRIPVPLVEKNTGRMWCDYEWIDAIRVIKINRSLVSREWTSSSGTGSAAKNEGIPVVTKDGIQLSLGVAITVFIEEEDAPTYLYYHGEQPLTQVTDVNIRNFCISELTREYSTLDLSDAKTNGPTIFRKLYDDAKSYFKTKGISVQQLGNAEGYIFNNPTIQEAINRRFTAEQDIQTASQEKLAQDQRNFKVLATAKTTADAAKLIFEAKEATTLQNQLEIATMKAKAALTMAEKWDGKMPANILPSDSNLLLNLGTEKVK